MPVACVANPHMLELSPLNIPSVRYAPANSRPPGSKGIELENVVLLFNSLQRLPI
jgi:hypothetical protein